MSASMNYILIYVINLAIALIECQAHPLNGMHNSSAGREATEGLSSQGQGRGERRGEGERWEEGEELVKEGEQVGLEGRGEKGPGITFQHSVLGCQPLSL